MINALSDVLEKERIEGVNKKIIKSNLYNKTCLRICPGGNFPRVDTTHLAKKSRSLLVNSRVTRWKKSYFYRVSLHRVIRRAWERLDWHSLFLLYSLLKCTLSLHRLHKRLLIMNLFLLKTIHLHVQFYILPKFDFEITSFSFGSCCNIYYFNFALFQLSFSNNFSFWLFSLFKQKVNISRNKRGKL